MSPVVIEKLEITVEGDKRQYLPLKVKWTCVCGKQCEKNYTDYYLSYPTFNRPCKETLYCGACDAEREITIIPTIGFEIVDQPQVKPGPANAPIPYEHLLKLHDMCRSFIDKQEFYGGESCVQSDAVHIEGPDFIVKIGDHIGWAKCSEED